MELLLLAGGLVLFVLLVVVHEFGHFIMARRGGVDVEEFGIGFPPKIWTFYRDKKGTNFTLNLLPLGGFVRLKGEHDADREVGAFGAAPFFVKTKIILAGVVMNVLTAWLIFSFLALVGIPKLPLPGDVEQFTVKSDTTVVSNKVFIGALEPKGPAELSGLRAGDQIIGLEQRFTNPSAGACNTPSGECFDLVERAEDVRGMVRALLEADKTAIDVLVLSDDKERIVNVSSRSIEEVDASSGSSSPVGFLGIQPYNATIQRSTWSAPLVGAGLTWQFSELTYKSLASTVGSLFQGRGQEASQNVAGPVGIFVVLRDGAKMGVQYILMIIGLLSLTLAIMNSLPIPALDGGKIAVMALFRLIKKPLTAPLEERIHFTGFATLMIIFVVLTVIDVRRFF